MHNQIADDWLKNFIGTALARDLHGHMQLISPGVLVFGVPGFDTLDYDDWYRQCEHEFPQGLLEDLSYERLVMRSADDENILFKALETTKTHDGGQIAQGVEMLLERDGDAWRLRQLRVLPEDEARHDGLI